MTTSATGAYTGLSYLAETVFGTTPAGTYTSLRNTGPGLGITKDIFKSNELRDDRGVSDLRHGVKKITGEIPIEISYGEFDPILEAALGGTWAANVLKTGVVERSFTLRQRHADILTDGLFTGCKINTFSMKCPANAMVTGSFGVIGHDATYVGTPHTVVVTITSACTGSANATITIGGAANLIAVVNEDTTGAVAGKLHTQIESAGYTATVDGSAVTIAYPAVLGNCDVTWSAGTTGVAATVATPVIVDPTASQTNSPYDSFAGLVKENNVESAIITSIDWQVSNGYTPAYVVGDDTAQHVVPGRCDVTGTLSALFQNITLMNKFINETESSIELQLGSTAKYYTILFDRIKYTGGSAPVSGEGLIALNMPFQALLDPDTSTTMTVTRIPA